MYSKKESKIVEIKNILNNQITFLDPNDLDQEPNYFNYALVLLDFKSNNLNNIGENFFYISYDNNVPNVSCAIEELLKCDLNQLDGHDSLKFASLIQRATFCLIKFNLGFKKSHCVSFAYVLHKFLSDNHIWKKFDKIIIKTFESFNFSFNKSELDKIFKFTFKQLTKKSIFMLKHETDIIREKLTRTKLECEKWEKCNCEETCGLNCDHSGNCDPSCNCPCFKGSKPQSCSCIDECGIFCVCGKVCNKNCTCICSKYENQQFKSNSNASKGWSQLLNYTDQV